MVSSSPERPNMQKNIASMDQTKKGRSYHTCGTAPHGTERCRASVSEGYRLADTARASRGRDRNGTVQCSGENESSLPTALYGIRSRHTPYVDGRDSALQKQPLQIAISSHPRDNKKTAAPFSTSRQKQSQHILRRIGHRISETPRQAKSEEDTDTSTTHTRLAQLRSLAR